MRQDLRFALHALVRHPGLTAAAILAGALGVGAATAVFSVVDRLLFRPLPYRDGASLVSVGILAPLDSNEFLFTQNYLDLRRAAARGPLHPSPRCRPARFAPLLAFRRGTARPAPAALFLAAATCVAAWIPARRAARVHPAEVLAPE